MTTLYLIRHGQTEWNVEGRYTGQSDIPLNDFGREEAARVAEKMKESGLTAIYSSDLERAFETARAIAESCGLPIKTDSRLREINQGVWEGMLFPDIKKQFQDELDKRDNDPLNVGAPGGETVGEVRSRVLKALEDILGQHQGKNERLAIVAHGFIIAVIRVYFGGISPEKTWDYFPGTTEVIPIEKAAMRAL